MRQNDEVSSGKLPPHPAGEAAERSGNPVIFLKREDQPYGHDEQDSPIEGVRKAARNSFFSRHARTKKSGPPIRRKRRAGGAEEDANPGLRSHRAAVLVKLP